MQNEMAHIALCVCVCVCFCVYVWLSVCVSLCVYCVAVPISYLLNLGHAAACKMNRVSNHCVGVCVYVCVCVCVCVCLSVFVCLCVWLSVRISIILTSHQSCGNQANLDVHFLQKPVHPTNTWIFRGQISSFSGQNYTPKMKSKLKFV